MVRSQENGWWGLWAFGAWENEQVWGISAGTYEVSFKTSRKRRGGVSMYARVHVKFKLQLTALLCPHDCPSSHPKLSRVNTSTHKL